MFGACSSPEFVSSFLWPRLRIFPPTSISYFVACRENPKGGLCVTDASLVEFFDEPFDFLTLSTFLFTTRLYCPSLRQGSALFLAIRGFRRNVDPESQQPIQTRYQSFFPPFDYVSSSPGPQLAGLLSFSTVPSLLSRFISSRWRAPPPRGVDVFFRTDALLS